jgi:hypothetical protein
VVGIRPKAGWVCGAVNCHVMDIKLRGIHVLSCHPVAGQYKATSLARCCVRLTKPSSCRGLGRQEGDGCE